MKIMTKKTISGLALSVALISSAQAADVEVMHWWTSGGEAKALGELKQSLAKQGVGWKDTPVAGGGGSNAMTVLRARVLSGQSPTAVQMLGFDIQDWGDQGVVANLNQVAKQEGWDKVVPSALQQFSKYQGKWISVPVNVHSTNWVWGNKAVLDKIGVGVPKNWNDLILAMEKAKKAGYVALAHGGQAWQDATVFDGVVLATGGVDFYRKALIELDPAALSSDTMKRVFDRMAQLRGFVDKNYPGRDWNLASAMVIKGKAAFQMMGDWAKGEFLSAGKQPGKDFVCFRTPGSQGAITFNADQFTMFKVDKAHQPAQQQMAKAVLSPEFQINFNKVKGSAPARTDISDERFDDCGKKAIADLKEAVNKNSLVGSLAHGHAAPAAIKSAFYDVITAHFNGEFSSEEAVKALVSSVKNAS
ncbi:ABC transporter substrate-binding protein [Spartinivicinus poritis]|uniref:Probable sugar-binding periplasmic protein n=1 Tax=Spartinivicinus poritis TaxID=2994640 RepID=A0ABT5UDE6_9GAMM|nr:ABC transporter substrate-binding protein [Spartinivicinus sp. A2-2]MDE1463483.1 ABC transporter substrate-binding protein [Spartinivicinus sp. A2-2]